MGIDRSLAGEHGPQLYRQYRPKLRMGDEFPSLPPSYGATSNLLPQLPPGVTTPTVGQLIKSQVSDRRQRH
jgi:hypothetical protein